jgi:hypothetical protein
VTSSERARYNAKPSLLPLPLLLLVVVYYDYSYLCIACSCVVVGGVVVTRYRASNKPTQHNPRFATALLSVVTRTCLASLDEVVASPQCLLAVANVVLTQYSD